MQKTPVTADLAVFPQQMHDFLRHAQLFDSSSSPEAQVWFIDKGEGFYLKRAQKDALADEAALTGYFYNKGLGVEVLNYISDEQDWLLTRAAAGEDCTHLSYLAQPERLAQLLGMQLRTLHELPAANCPVKNSTALYLSRLREGYEKGLFDPSMRIFDDLPAEREACYRFAMQRAPLLRADTLIHGDYCLPNVVLNDWRFSAFIDVAHGGVGDRHIDLYWGIWSLRHNLGTDRYTEHFLAAYGQDKVDMLRLRTVACMECFG